MNNFPITHDGKTYWISRSMAVSCFVLTAFDNEWFILANKRGENAPDFKGLWNCPCGYLDFNETTAEAAIRETYEETGVRLSTVNFWRFVDSTTENNQNVTFRYYAITSDPQWVNMRINSEDRGGESGEVSEIAWIPIHDIDKYSWAFNHSEIIKELVLQLGLN